MTKILNSKEKKSNYDKTSKPKNKSKQKIIIKKICKKMHKNCLNKVEKFCQQIRQGSYFICTVCYRRVTRNFLGQRSFVLIRSL